jgi:alpha-glucosidase (family GH31 glycosyl hydrolase)
MHNTALYKKINHIYEGNNKLILELTNETNRKLFIHFYLDMYLNIKLTTTFDEMEESTINSVKAIIKRTPNYGIKIISENSNSEYSNIEILNSKDEVLLDYQLHSQGITIELDDHDTVVSITMLFKANAKGYYGFGEKYDSVNQLGYDPITYVFDHFTNQGKDTYLPMPYFLTECGWGYYNSTDYETDFNITELEDGANIQIRELTESKEVLHNSYLLFGEPIPIIKQFHKITGECKLPPKWSFGPWMSANGWNTQKETIMQFKKTQELQIPATVLVLEAWSDETNFYIFNGAKYEPKSGDEFFNYSDFSFDGDNLWDNPKEMIDLIHEGGTKVVLWQIPIIKPSVENDNLQLTNDEKTAIEKHYCVMNADGTPYRILKNWFEGCLILDVTNEEAINCG